MIDKLKAPFWFGLPVYAWVAGAVALVAGIGYFGFYARASAGTAAPQVADSGSADTVNPFPADPGGVGAAVPPSPVFDNNGTVIGTSTSPSYLQQQSQPIQTPTQVLVQSSNNTWTPKKAAAAARQNDNTFTTAKNAILAAVNRGQPTHVTPVRLL